MLVHLHVKNLALIDEIDVEFSERLNILTGETGAGKSIIIDSINSALGAKVSKDIIRTGSEYALVELLFNIDNEKVVQYVKEMDIPIDDNRELLISRKINNQGRSIQKINGKNVTISMLKEIANYLLDIHGQHEHQSLLHKKNHLIILDEFCGEQLKGLKSDLVDLLNEYHKIVEQVNDLNNGYENRQREIDFLKYELNEIETANLKINEDEELNIKYKKMSHAKQITESISTVYSIINSNNNSVTDNISKSIKMLRQVEKYDNNICNFNEQLETVDQLINDLCREINIYIEDIIYDDSIFNEIDSRLNQINILKSKYGNSIEDILNYYEQGQIKLEQLENSNEYKKTLSKKIDDLQIKLSIICEKISDIRKVKSKEVALKIISALIDLNFLDVKFDISIKQTNSFTNNGWDDVEFMISTNPGESLKPLSKVASGGELSRIMLAIKSVLASTDEIETLIFDEIDVGISRRTSQKVAEKLAVISRSHQVICITHLPQIAAMADSHYVIEKTTDYNSTVTKINKLNENDIINEIARLISGVEVTDLVINSASEMKKLANKVKENSK